MNKRNAQKALKAKFDAWVNTIQDTEIKELVKNGTIITGGAIVSLLSGEEVKDFDVYFVDKNTALRVAEYYVGWFNTLNDRTEATEAIVIDGSYIDDDLENHSLSARNIRSIRAMTADRIKVVVKSSGIAMENGQTLQNSEPTDDVYDILQNDEQLPEQKSKPKYRPVFLSSNAITLSDKMQLVVRFYGEPEDIHKNYDFVHCTNYWTSWDNTLTLRPQALEAILAKELRYVGSKYPVCSLIRTRKFIKRGWHINAGQYLKMAFQVSQLDLTDVDVLEEQLVGVDSAYFDQLINGLRKNIEKNPEFEVNSSYLAELIDRLF